MERFDLLIKWGTGFAVSAVSYLFGGWSQALEALMLLNILDFATGWLAAGKNGELKSKVSFNGIRRKVFMWCMVAVGAVLDSVLGADVQGMANLLPDVGPLQLTEGHIIRDSIVYAYILNEFLSITENGGKAGFWVPGFLKKMIEVLKPEEDKGENE
jgi:phage-related holin